MARQAVQQRCVRIRLACSAVGISETCYRYQSRLSSENAEIADWLIRLTHTHRHWGFVLCFLYLRNVTKAMAGTISVYIVSTRNGNSTCASNLKSGYLGKCLTSWWNPPLSGNLSPLLS